MGAIQMIRTISLIAFFVFFAMPRFAFAQVEMCEAWVPAGPSLLTLDSTNKYFTGGSSTTSASGQVYTIPTGRKFPTPELAYQAGIYYSDNTSSQSYDLNGTIRNCGARLYAQPCYDTQTKQLVPNQIGIMSEPINGCPYSDLVFLYGSTHEYFPYSNPVIENKRICSLASGTTHSNILRKITVPKQTTPEFMDVFSMGWFWTDDDTNDTGAIWKNQSGKSPVEVMFLQFLGSAYQEFCYDGSKWEITDVGNVDMDPSSTIINGKKWREFYVEVIMYQKTCYDCDVSYTDGLWNKPSPAGTTGTDGGGGGGGDTGGEEEADGETEGTVCVEGDTRAACSTIDAPPSGENAVIPEYSWTFNDPQGQPSFASPWTLSGSAECPANVSFSVSGYGLNDLDFTQLCGLISGPMRAVLLFIASLTALAIAIPRP